MVLLHLLQALAGKHGWKLTVAHFNHELRGRASVGDERFVRTVCARLKLRCITGRGDVRGHAKERGLSLEMAARELRHKFLAQTARRFRLSHIVLAHHASDQVELFFLRLLRGASHEGLAGMKWRAPSPADSGVELVRPLLDVSRPELEQYARQNKIRFREDASNASRDVLRNRIRHELLPLLRRGYQPALDRTVLRLMEIIGAESEVLAEAAQTWLKAKRPKPFGSLPVAVQRHALRGQLKQHNLKADFELIEQLRENSHQPVSVSPLVSVARDEKGRVQIRLRAPADFNPRQLPVTLGERAGECSFDGVSFRWRLATAKRAVIRRGRLRCEYLDADRISSRVLLRHWRAGDRYQPIGMYSSVKLQDWFTNRKIPRGVRRQLVVAATVRGEIFWIEGQRISERFKLTSHTKRRLIWRWKRL